MMVLVGSQNRTLRIFTFDVTRECVIGIIAEHGHPDRGVPATHPVSLVNVYKCPT